MRDTRQARRQGGASSSMMGFDAGPMAHGINRCPGPNGGTVQAGASGARPFSTGPSDAASLCRDRRESAGRHAVSQAPRGQEKPLPAHECILLSASDIGAPILAARRRTLRGHSAVRIHISATTLCTGARRAFLACLPPLCVFWLAIAQAAADPVADLARRLEPSLPRGEVVIALDASGSMSGRYAAVRSAALRFAEGLGSRETVSARAFGASITQAIVGSGAEARAALEGGLPRAPMAGTGTDLGLALSKALDDLDKPDAAPVQALFVLTDGLHQPPPDSPYSTDFVRDPNWRRLKERAAAIARRSHLTVYGLGIGGETDIGVLRQVFPAQNVEILSGDAATAGAALARLQRNLRLIRLKMLLVEDLREGKIALAPSEPKPGPSLDEWTIDCVINSTYKALPVRLTNVRLEPSGQPSAPLSANLQAPDTLQVEPQATTTVKLTARLADPRSRWALGRRQEDLSAAWRVTAIPEFPDRAALRELRIEGSPRWAPAEAALRTTIAYGKPWWAFGAFAAALVLTALGWRRRVVMLQSPGVSGTLLVGSKTIDLAQYGKESVTVGPPSADVPLPGATANTDVVTLRMREEGDSAQLAAYTEAFGVKRNGETLAGEQLVSDNDEISLGQQAFVVLSAGRALVRQRRIGMFVLGAVSLLVLAIVLIRS